MARRDLTAAPATPAVSAGGVTTRGGLGRRILHVLWSMEIGGAERAVYQLVREQRRRGDRADVLLASHAGFYGERCREAGASVLELGQRSALDLSAAAAARGVFAEYHIVHFHNVEPLLVRAATRVRGPRLFYTHRGGTFRYPPRQRVRYGVATRYVRRFNGLSGNTAQGARAAARLFRLPPDRVSVTYNGIDFSLLAPVRPAADVLAELGGRDDAVRVGTSGNLRPWKRIDRLVRALARLRVDPVQLIVIGDGPARPGLEQLAAELGVGHRVRFVGRREHVGDYLQVLDVFALPSGPEESFGNSAVEAMGVGIPAVVAADGGGLIEHVEDGCTGFVVRDQAELERRLAHLARNPGLRAALGTAARASVRARYSTAAMVERYDELYDVGAARGMAMGGRRV